MRIAGDGLGHFLELLALDTQVGLAEHGPDRHAAPGEVITADGQPGGQLQVAEQGDDLRALENGGVANQPVRDAGLQQGQLHRHRLGEEPHQHRRLTQRPPLGEPLLYHAGQGVLARAGLPFARCGRSCQRRLVQQGDSGCRRTGRREAQPAVTPRIMGDEMVGGQGQGMAVAKGVGEQVVARLGKIDLEAVGDILGAGPAPLVDALVDIADHHHLGTRAGDDLQEQLLGLVDILVFVDDDMVDPVADPGGERWVGLHGEQRLVDEIGVKAQPEAAARLLEDGEGTGEVAIPGGQAKPGQDLGRLAGRPLDQIEKGEELLDLLGRRPALLLLLEGLDHRLAGKALEAVPRGFETIGGQGPAPGKALHQAQAEGVEGAHFGQGPLQVGQAGCHGSGEGLPRRTVEHQHEDLVGGDALPQQVADAADHRCRLTRSGHRPYPGMAARVGDDAPLFLGIVH